MVYTEFWGGEINLNFEANSFLKTTVDGYSESGKYCIRFMLVELKFSCNNDTS